VSPPFVRPTIRLQPRRLIVAPPAAGCKPQLDDPSKERPTTNTPKEECRVEPPAERRVGGSQQLQAIESR
jgi:hypothetical protein